MSELNPSHIDKVTPPPPTFLPVVEKTKKLYAIWILIHRKIPRTERFGIGLRIDNAFLDLLTALRRASFSEPRQKIPLLEMAVVKIDDIRFFIQLLWENRLVSNEQYISLNLNLETIGNNVGGWRKETIKKTSPTKIGEER
jgi:hypothetical protein